MSVNFAVDIRSFRGMEV